MKDDLGHRLQIYEHDFGRAIISDQQVVKYINKLNAEAAGDGRKKSVRAARAVRRKLDDAILSIGELGYRAGAAAYRISCFDTSVYHDDR
jgi:hypothetical protein